MPAVDPVTSAIFPASLRSTSSSKETLQQLTSGSGNCQLLGSTCKNAVAQRILGWALAGLRHYRNVCTEASADDLWQHRARMISQAASLFTDDGSCRVTGLCQPPGGVTHSTSAGPQVFGSYV